MVFVCLLRPSDTNKERGRYVSQHFLSNKNPNAIAGIFQSNDSSQGNVCMSLGEPNIVEKRLLHRFERMERMEYSKDLQRKYGEYENKNTCNLISHS